MQRRKLGDFEVGAIGLGAMPMSLDGRPPRDQAVRTIHAALDAGITLIDTADVYCQDADDVGHNERLVAEALATWSGDRGGVIVATKGGHTRGGKGSWGHDGRPAYLRSACEASLRALGTDCVDLYQFHRPDPSIPVEESVGALAELQQAGKVRMIGVSNFSIDQIQKAQSVAGIVSVQNEFSPAFRGSKSENAYCETNGIAFLAWSPLGGMGAAAALPQRHRAFAAVAQESGVSAQRVTLAWELAQSPTVIPIPGASRPETILDSLMAVEVELTADQLRRLDDA